MLIKEKYDYVAVFDFETTGLNPEGDLSKFTTTTYNAKQKRWGTKEYLAKQKEKEKDKFIEVLDKSKVIELGLSLYKIKDDHEFELIDDVDLLIKQDKPLDPQIVAVTRITDDLLNENGVDEETLFKTLQYYLSLDRTLWCGYNIQFDFTFINQLFRDKTSEKDYFCKKDMLDCMAIYKDFYDFDFNKKINNDGSTGYYGHRLDAAVKNLKIDVKNTHRALDDVHATFEVFRRFDFALSDKIDFYINKFGYNKKFGVSFTEFPHIEYIKQEGGKEEIYHQI